MASSSLLRYDAAHHSAASNLVLCLEPILETRGDTVSQNPYEAPTIPAQAVGINSGSRDDLKSVAKYQKGILVCILIYIVTVFGQLAVPANVRFIFAIVVVLTGLVGTIFVFLLAMKVYSPAVGVLYGILTLVPCIGLLMLMVVNGKATSVLKQNGIKVGLLGADLSQI
jgi:hypothetical protein